MELDQSEPIIFRRLQLESEIFSGHFWTFSMISVSLWPPGGGSSPAAIQGRMDLLSRSLHGIFYLIGWLVVFFVKWLLLLPPWVIVRVLWWKVFSGLNVVSHGFTFVLNHMLVRYLDMSIYGVRCTMPFSLLLLTNSLKLLPVAIKVCNCTATTVGLHNPFLVERTFQECLPEISASRVS